MNGKLIIKVYVDNIAQPLKDASVKIEGNEVSKTSLTNEIGETETFSLKTPKIEYSEVKSENKPYSEYDVVIFKEGLGQTTIHNVQIFPDVVSFQEVFLKSEDENSSINNEIIVPQHSLFFAYAPKIFENKNKIIDDSEGLSKPTIPEFIIVHDGFPTNTNSSNYIVSWTNYIKNVASGVVYPTWGEETIKATILAIISFTLNRIWSKWYFKKGYAWTITSTSQYDQKYAHGRTIFKPISDMVDEVFNQYLKLDNSAQPFLAQYDTLSSDNKECLSLWNSKELGDKGFKAIDILKHFYGETISLDTVEKIEGFNYYPLKEDMKLNSCGKDIQILQNKLNIICPNYPSIPKINTPNGEFNEETKKAVEIFQSIFCLPMNGEVNNKTWYKINCVYIEVKKMLNGVYQQ